MISIDLPLSKGQAEFMRRCDDPLVIMHTSISYGKSYIAALYLITEMMKGRKCLVGAQTHSAVRKVLFNHIKNICRKIHVEYEENKTDRSMKISNGITYAFSAESVDECLGMTDVDTLVLDEASRLPEEFYHNMKSRMRGGLAVTHTRLITSPNEAPSARWFNELVKYKPECVITGSLYENPFVSEEFIHEMEEMYGIGTPLYKRQVLGEPIEGDYLNAIVRSEDFAGPEYYTQSNTPYFYGMDFAAMGRDCTSRCVINKTGIIALDTANHMDTNSQLQYLEESFMQYNWSSGCLDLTGGYGNGVYDMIKHNPKYTVRGITFGEKPSNEMYKNIRSEMYLELAKLIKDGFYIDKQKYPKLVEELRNTQCYIDEKGKFRIIPKEDIKKNIGRSPDSADALALAVYAMQHLSPNNVKAAIRQASLIQSMGYFSRF